MGTNKVASVILFDVSQNMKIKSENGETFFERSLNYIKKMILRKMFSQDNDEMGIILFGADETDNSLARGTLYNYISIFSHLSLPNWDLFRRVADLTLSSRTTSNWIEALVVGIDFMKTETQGRRYKTKQIVIFSSFSGDTPANNDTMTPLVNTLEGENISLLLIGNKMEDVGSEKSLFVAFNTMEQLHLSIHYSFDDIERDFMYFETKRKMCRLLKVNLSIGSNIQLPVRWMKVTNEKTRFKWDFPLAPKIQGSRSTADVTERQPDKEIEYVMDTVKYTNFGSTCVELSYADIQAMSRKTGAPSFIYIGSVKSSKISRGMFVSNDLYVVVPDKDARSVAMFSAFVDALLSAGKYGIARRVAVKNGKINVGALLPVSDELGKAMYFLKLPLAEWVQVIPEKPLPEPDNAKATKAIDDLIDAAMLPEDLADEGNGLLVRDPTFQSRCHALYLRAIGKLPESSIIDLPETVQRIINPFPLNEDAKRALHNIAEIYPFTELEEKTVSPNKKKTEPESSSNGKKLNALDKGKIEQEISDILTSVKNKDLDFYNDEF